MRRKHKIPTGRKVGRPKLWENMNSEERRAEIQRQRTYQRRVDEAERGDQEREREARRRDKQAKILGMLVAILAVVIIFIGWKMYRAHQEVTVATTPNSSQVAFPQHNSKEKPLGKIAAGDELLQLTNATNDYEKDRDQGALVDKLQTVETENKQLETRLPEGHAKEAVQAINKTASQVQHDPNNAGKIAQNNVEELAQQSGFWGNIYYRVRSLIANW